MELQLHEEEDHHQWVAMEEEEETTLEGRKSLHHRMAGSSSCSSPTLQKVEEIAVPGTDMSYISENNKHHPTDEEVEDALTNVEAITAITTTTSAALQNIGSSVNFDNQKDIQNTLINDVTDQSMKTVVYNGQFNSESSPSHGSSEVHLNDEISTKADPDLIEDFDQQLWELDVEAVLAKQETHDLFCPNCKSCITKRVILRKRKRRTQSLDPKAKRDKFETLVSSKLVDNVSAYEANQGDHTITVPDVGSAQPPSVSNHHEREPEVFRCLSCFSYFIPTGNGFNLLRKFFGTRGREQEPSQNSSSAQSVNLQDPSRLPVSDVKIPPNIQASNTNWFFSKFTSNMATKTNSVASMSLPGDIIHENGRDLLAAAVTIQGVAKAGEPEKDRSLKPNDRESDLLIPSNVGSPILEKSEKDIYKKSMAMEDKLTVQSSYSTSMQRSQIPAKSFGSAEVTGDAITDREISAGDVKYLPEQDLEPVEKVRKEIEEETDSNLREEKKGNDVIVDVEAVIKSKTFQTEDSVPVSSATLQSTQGLQIPAQSFGSAGVTSDAIADTEISGGDGKYLPEQDLKPVVVEKVRKEIEEEIDSTATKEKKGSDVIVVVEAAAKSKTFQTEDSVPVSGATLTETSAQTQVHIDDQAGDEVGEPYGIEILKSTVYGGLVESITSLGIVTSAASTGSSPLNIIALGLANLVAGIFIIGHHLMELKNDDSGGDSQQMNQQKDRYQKVLGRRANFALHAVVVVLSFLIFGSIPIVIYGILTHDNYSSNVKVGAVAATSIVCIILLAVAKVYTKEPPKSYIKTVLYYVTMAIGTAGVSYVVGDLIKDLLEKLSHREAGFVIAMPTTDKKPAWTPY